MWRWKTENETNDVFLKYQHIKKDRGSVPGELYEELHFVLDSLRLIEKEFLIMCANLVCDEKADEIFTRVQEFHVAFWKAVNRPMFDSDILLICWQRLKKLTRLASVLIFLYMSLDLRDRVRFLC